MADTAPNFTIIYPGIDVRGHAAEHLKAWAIHQSLPRDRYRIIAVLSLDSPDAEEVQKLLGPGDTLLTGNYSTDIAMWNAGAAAAETPWVVFTEGHGLARPNCLQELDKWLASDPSADAGNFAIGHHDHYLMARLSRRWFGEQQARWQSEWPRLHRAGFAIRRKVFDAVGGFQPYGQFGVPLLSALLDADGYRVETVPGTEVLHLDDETVYDHHFDTIDYVRGECRARCEHDPDFFEKYFGQDPHWQNHLVNDPHVSRKTIVAALKAMLGKGMHNPEKMGSLFRVAFSFLPKAFALPEVKIALGEAITPIEEALLLEVPLPSEWRYRWFIAAHRRVVKTSRRKWIQERSKRPAPGICRLTESIRELNADVLGGVHGLERHEGRDFRWTEPSFHLRFDAGEQIRKIHLDTGGLLGNAADSIVLTAVGDHPIGEDFISGCDDGLVSITIPAYLAKTLGEEGITLCCREAETSPDESRKLGMPIFSVSAE